MDLLKYFIEIDLDSINVNANAGNTITHIPTTIEVKFDFIGDYENFNLLKEFEKDKTCVITEITYFESNDKIIKCNGILYNPNKISEFKSIEYVNIEYNKNYVILNHFPIPKYSFKYIDSEVGCSECGSKFNFSELEAEEYDFDGEDYYDTTTKCPKCNTWDCCEIEYETIENALIRLNNNIIK